MKFRSGNIEGECTLRKEKGKLGLLPLGYILSRETLDGWL